MNGAIQSEENSSESKDDPGTKCQDIGIPRDTDNRERKHGECQKWCASHCKGELKLQKFMNFTTMHQTVYHSVYNQ